MQFIAGMLATIGVILILAAPPVAGCSTPRDAVGCGLAMATFGLVFLMLSLATLTAKAGPEAEGESEEEGEPDPSEPPTQ